MVWTPGQAGTFLDYAEGHDIVLYPLFLLILHGGPRRGEAVGLRDTDVDLDGGALTIGRRSPPSAGIRSSRGQEGRWGPEHQPRPAHPGGTANL